MLRLNLSERDKETLLIAINGYISEFEGWPTYAKNVDRVRAMGERLRRH